MEPITVLVDPDTTDHERQLIQRAVTEALTVRDEQWAEHVQSIAQAVADAVTQQVAQNTPESVTLSELVAAMNRPKVQRVERDDNGRITAITTTAA